MNTAQEAEALRIMDAAAAQLSKLHLNTMTISEIFVAYGVRHGWLTDGEPVFQAARKVIDLIERETSE
jgi:hypothetical protein